MLKEKRLLTVQATEKTLELMELLASGNNRLRIGELAGKLCLSRNDVLMLLVTLENRGLVLWNDAGKFYKPGPRFTDLARQFLGLCAAPVEKPAAPSDTKKKARSLGAPKLRSKRYAEVGSLAAIAP